MARNKLFSIRLDENTIQALADKFPGLSTVESIRSCIEEVLGMTSQGHPIDVIGSVNEILETVYLRLDKLERAIAIPDKDIQGDIQEVTTTSPDNQEDKDIQGDIQEVTTTSPDNQEDKDITTTSPDNQEDKDIQGDITTPDKDIQGDIQEVTTTIQEVTTVQGDITSDKDIQEVGDIQEVTTVQGDITSDKEIREILDRDKSLSNRAKVNLLKDLGVRILGKSGKPAYVSMETIKRYL